MQKNTRSLCVWHTQATTAHARACMFFFVWSCACTGNITQNYHVDEKTLCVCIVWTCARACIDNITNKSGLSSTQNTTVRVCMFVLCGRVRVLIQVSDKIISSMQKTRGRVCMFVLCWRVRVLVSDKITSSMQKTRGRVSMARARHNCCRSPNEKFSPPEFTEYKRWL